MTKISILLCFILSASTLQAEMRPRETILVGFVSPQSKDFFERTVIPYWRKLDAGTTVQLISLTPFNSKGEVDLDLLAFKIRNAPPAMKSIYIHWNEKYEPVHRNWLAELHKKTLSGTRVAFFAGLSKPGSKTIPLRKTLASQVPKALVLGELLERERLPPLHFYGPELFSAFNRQKQVKATGLAPLNFVSRWALQTNGKDLDQSLDELKIKKMKSLRIWPTTDELLGRYN